MTDVYTFADGSVDDFDNFLQRLPHLPLHIIHNGRIRMKYDATAGRWLRGSFGQIASWRGIYAEPTLTIDGEKELYPSDVRKIIADQIYDTHEGWKGGVYNYNYNSPLNFDNEGCYSSNRRLQFEIGTDAITVRVIDNHDED